jgi:hypothetical protein
MHYNSKIVTINSRLIDLFLNIVKEITFLAFFISFLA